MIFADNFCKQVKCCTMLLDLHAQIRFDQMTIFSYHSSGNPDQIS